MGLGCSKVINSPKKPNKSDSHQYIQRKSSEESEATDDQRGNGQVNKVRFLLPETQQKGKKPSNKSQLDPACNHEYISNHFSISKEWNCIICKELKSNCPSFTCKLCSVNICKSCFEWNGKYQKSSQEDLRCPQNHELRVIPVRYLYTYYNIHGAKLPCSVCAGTFKVNEASHHCRSCKFDICGGCVSAVRYGLKQNMACSNGHLCGFSYTCSKKLKIKCLMCGSVYERMGFMSCEECRYRICLRCVR